MKRDLDHEISEAQDALSDWLSASLPDDALVCECYCVSALDIRQSLSPEQSIDLEVLREKFGLGSGCGRCLIEKETWVKQIVR